MDNTVRRHDVRLSQLRNTCASCSLVQLCLPLSLDAGDVERLDSIVQRRRPLERGESLYRVGDTFHQLYAIRAGSLKTVATTPDGEEQVIGFHLPGELVGLDAIVDGRHPCSATALETTSVCEIPYLRLEELAGRIPSLQHQLLRIMSRELLADQEMLHALARRTAEQRLAILLLSLSDRFARRGLSASRLRLPMSRSDLSNYLGLAPETMSRLFRRFEEQGLISANGREVVLENSAALAVMAGRAGGVPAAGI